jgi:hypothetical protein
MFCNGCPSSRAGDWRWSSNYEGHVCVQAFSYITGIPFNLNLHVCTDVDLEVCSSRSVGLCILLKINKWHKAALNPPLLHRIDPTLVDRGYPQFSTKLYQTFTSQHCLPKRRNVYFALMIIACHTSTTKIVKIASWFLKSYDFTSQQVNNVSNQVKTWNRSNSVKIRPILRVWPISSFNP